MLRGPLLELVTGRDLTVSAKDPRTAAINANGFFTRNRSAYTSTRGSLYLQ